MENTVVTATSDIGVGQGGKDIRGGGGGGRKLQWKNTWTNGYDNDNG